MPKIHILSDLHYEFHADAGKSFTDCLPSAEKTGADALVVAGDLCPAPGRYGTFGKRDLPNALGMLCDKYPRVIFVSGNHEFYGASWESLYECRGKILGSPRFRNLHWLDDDICELSGVRILGTSLWFRRDDHAPKDQMNDFRAIHGFEDWVYKENERAEKFLYAELRKDDVLLTHYLPSHESVAPEFAGSPLNAFFVCDIEDLIAVRKPQLAIHGHTHSSMNYPLGPTRVVCNPFGYAGHEENPKFDPGLVIDIHASTSKGTSKRVTLP